jgi:hypothetical protein
VRSKHDGAASARARGGLARSLLLFLLPVVFLPLVTFAIVIYQQVQADIRRQVTAQFTTHPTHNQHHNKHTPPARVKSRSISGRRRASPISRPWRARLTW